MVPGCLSRRAREDLQDNGHGERGRGGRMGGPRRLCVGLLLLICAASSAAALSK